LAAEDTATGGSQRRSPVGGRAKGMFRNWRTLGVVWLMMPVYIPVFAVTWTVPCHELHTGDARTEAAEQSAAKARSTPIMLLA